MLSGFPYSSYYTVYGDGNNLYCAQSFADHTDMKAPFYTSPETDGTSWTLYQSGTQRFSDGPYVMRFDKVNRIMYAACWNAGLWALKLSATGTQGDNSKENIRKEINSKHNINPEKIVLSRKLVDKLDGVRFYDVKGMLIHPEVTSSNNAIRTPRVLIAVHK